MKLRLEDRSTGKKYHIFPASIFERMRSSLALFPENSDLVFICDREARQALEDEAVRGEVKIAPLPPGSPLEESFCEVPVLIEESV